MPIVPFLRSLREYAHDENNAYLANTNKFLWRLGDVTGRTWDLGFTAFGGPPVHFQIEHRRFVQGTRGRIPWIDERVYQELFAICQALPGPGSTKMLFCIVLIHAGILPALFAFLLWSLPGAIGMFCLSLGVRQIDEVLPAIAYAFLSGLNASTVGIVALAAVQLAEKAISDKITRVLVIFGACAGLCYTALWYFPVLIVAGGIATVIWDLWLGQCIRQVRAEIAARKHSRSRQNQPSRPEADDSIELPENNNGPDENAGSAQRRHPATSTSDNPVASLNDDNHTHTIHDVDATDMQSYAIPIPVGLAIIAGFFGQSKKPSVDTSLIYISVFHCSTCNSWGPVRPAKVARSFCKYVSRGNYYLWWRASRHSPSARVCCPAWMGIYSRFLDWFGHHTGVSRSKFQLCCVLGSACDDWHISLYSVRCVC